VIDERGFWALIQARAEATPDLPLAIDERFHEISFRGYRDRCLRVAASLSERGVGAGDRVSWQLPNWIESAVLVGALARLGAVQNPIMPILRERELRHITRQVRPRLFVIPSVWRGTDYAKMVEPIATEMDFEMLACGRDLPEDAPPLPAEDTAPRDPDALRWILFTSGTTSVAKGAMHSDASIAAGARGLCDSLDVQASDRSAIPFPITHLSGVGMIMVFLMTGSSGAFVEQFDDSTAERLGRMGCTLATGGTPLVLRYLEQQRRQPDRKIFPALRAAMAGGAPKPPQLHREVRDEMGGLGVVSCYGSTEVPFLSLSTLADSDDQLERTEGRISPAAEVRIAAEDGTPLPRGAIGELRVRGPQVCAGYLDSSLDEEAFDRDGFFRTGDLARLDRDGYLTITGRLKDIIIRKGENISATEIEDVLYGHPGIAEVAVIGLPDPERGERCCAVVVPHPGRAIDLAEIACYCEEAGLARQKIPEQVERLDELPRNANGKVLKRELQARFGGVTTEGT